MATSFKLMATLPWSLTLLDLCCHHACLWSAPLPICNHLLCSYLFCILPLFSLRLHFIATWTSTLHNSFCFFHQTISMSTGQVLLFRRAVPILLDMASLNHLLEGLAWFDPSYHLHPWCTHLQAPSNGSIPLSFFFKPSSSWLPLCIYSVRSAQLLICNYLPLASLLVLHIIHLICLAYDCIL